MLAYRNHQEIGGFFYLSRIFVENLVKNLWRNLFPIRFHSCIT
jgi:hypothetical protein